MTEPPPMSLEAKLARRRGAEEYPEASTQAERFVDDTTLLRMLRLRLPSAKAELGGFDSDTLKAVHLGRAAREDWNTDATDIALRFEDGSIAHRLREAQRWEVYRQW